MIFPIFFFLINFDDKIFNFFFKVIREKWIVIPCFHKFLV